MMGVMQPGQIVSVDGFDDFVFPIDDSILLSTSWPATIKVNTSAPAEAAAPAPMLRLFSGVDNTGERFGFPYIDSFFEQAIAGYGSGFAKGDSK